jgi:uncharacterized pyridoxamine 5'-phosphate oxidase family protein
LYQEGARNELLYKNEYKPGEIIEVRPFFFNILPSFLKIFKVSSAQIFVLLYIEPKIENVLGTFPLQEEATEN